MDTGAAIRAKAIELGFDKVGIARAGALATERERLESWLERGFHAAMSWMEREPVKRTDPRLIFPDARSVVAVALNYKTDAGHDEGADRGKISRYAWGDDYHDVLRDRLNVLLDWIRTEFPGTDGKICIDTAPMMDKAWAAKAGLGWIGKHSNLITREIGSWIFLGEIILNIDLEPDEPTVQDHCGTCTACLDACPTGAIVEPYVVDSSRCISYATIELRDERLPEHIADNLKGWLYGCDICQEVCPWNRFEQATDEERFQPRSGETTLDIEELRQMEHEAYVVRFRKSAIKRAKLSGLKRNAAALAERCAVK